MHFIISFPYNNSVIFLFSYHGETAWKKYESDGRWNRSKRRAKEDGIGVKEEQKKME